MEKCMLMLNLRVAGNCLGEDMDYYTETVQFVPGLVDLCLEWILNTTVTRKGKILFISHTLLGCCLTIWSVIVWQQVYKVQITVNNICLLSHASALTALKKNNTLLSVGSHASLFMVNLIYLQYFCFNNWCTIHESFFSQGGKTASYLILLFSH